MTCRLAQEFQPEQIIWLGSYAWGPPDEGSDADLCVIVTASDQKPVPRAAQAYRAWHGLGFAKDILVKTRLAIERDRQVRSSLEHEILEHGRVLYHQLPRAAI
jgi:hypothetical protein